MATFRDALEAQRSEDSTEIEVENPVKPEGSAEETEEDPAIAELRALLADDEDPDEDDDEEDPLEPKPEGEEEDEEGQYSKRVRKRIGKANERRREAEARADELQGQIRGIADRYKDYANPLAQARVDADFMDALGEAIKTAPELKQLVQAVTEYQKTGKVTTVTQNNGATPSTPEKPERDPEVSAIIQENVSGKVEKALPGVNRLAIREVTEYVLSQENPTRLTEKDIRKSASKLFRERGYGESDIFTASREGESTKRPPTRSARAPSTKSAPNGRKGEEEPGGYKNLAEALEKRAARRRSFRDSLSG